MKMLAAIAAALLCALCPTEASSEVFRDRATVMGTVLEVTLDAPTKAKAQEAVSAIKDEMARIEGQMSEWRKGSQVSEINRYSGIRPVKVERGLFNVIAASLEVSRLSGGALDVTWASMRGLWDFRPGHERVPTASEIKARLTLVDYKDVVLDDGESTVFLRRRGMAIGLGAVAKGYAVDRAMGIAARAGIRNAIIKAGGDIRVQGAPDGSAGWEVGIQDPRDRGGLIARLTLTDVSISTSGDYERSFVKHGRLYHHIMDPRTGWPASGARSVTVIGPDTMTTDALSTAIFVLGARKGIELAERLGGVEAIVVDADGAMLTTSGIDLRR